MPVDGLVELHHPLLLRRVADEPRVEGIVEDWLVGTPGMRIGVHVLLYLEGRALLLHLHADDDVQVLILLGAFAVPDTVLVIFRVVGVLHVVAGMMAVESLVNTTVEEVLVELVDDIVLTLEVNHRTGLAFLVYEVEAGDSGILGHLGIVGTEGRRDVHDTGTVLCCNVVAEDNAEGLVGHLHEGVDAILTLEGLLRMCCGIVADEFLAVFVDFLAWLHPWHELAVVHTLEVGAFEMGHDFIRHVLVAVLVFRQLTVVGDRTARIEVCGHSLLGDDYRLRLCGIGVVGLADHIVNLWTYAQGHVRRQCPRCCRPCHEVRLAPVRLLQSLRLGLQFLPALVADTELCRNGGILDVAVAAGLCELMARQSCAVRRTVRLDGIAFVEQTFVVELLQKPPQRLDILIVVGDIRMVHVDEVSHLLSNLTPLLGKLHDVLAALMVVVLCRDVFRRRRIVYILLRDAKFLLHAELHGQSVGIPAGLTLHLEAAHSLIPVEGVLDGAGQHVVDTGVSVC